MATLDEYVDAWRLGGLGPQVAPAGSGHLVVTTRGGRVMPFDHRGRPLLWLNPEVNPEADVATWAASGAWNFGAERLWLGPELRLMVKDRADFDGTYELSEEMDPGSWQLSVEAGATQVASENAVANGSLGAPVGPGPASFRLHHEMRLPVYQPAATLRLEVAQNVSIAADPARRWQESRGLEHLGWAREVSVRRSPDDEREVACQAWVLAQVEAAATVLVPGAGAALVTDYFEPIDAAHLHRRGEDLALAITGRQRYKVGIRSGEHRGMVACWRGLPDGEAALLVRSFYDSPSSRYLEEPPGERGHEGDSLYVYNDGGRFGDFGEIEALGRALEPTADSVNDTFEFHVWWGERSALRLLATRLLGMDALAERESDKELP